jgi:hypothetical protein
MLLAETNTVAMTTGAAATHGIWPEAAAQTMMAGAAIPTETMPMTGRG